MAETTADETGPENGLSREELADLKIESDDIPVRGSPEEFLILVDELKGSGTRQISGIDEEIEEFGRTNLSGNVKYGEKLGFIERTAEGIILSERGVELAYAQDNDEDLSTHFISGLKQHEEYLAILLQFEGDSDYQSQIKNSDVLKVMYTNYDLREEKDTVLKRATSILFETLELASFGEVMDASGGLPTRFNFTNSWETDSMIAELLPETSSNDEPPVEDSQSESQAGEVKEIKDKSTTEGEEEAEEESMEASAEVNNTPQIASDNADPNPANTEEFAEGSKQVAIEIELQIDVNKMDSAELGEKIQHINKLLQ